MERRGRDGAAPRVESRRRQQRSPCPCSNPVADDEGADQQSGRGACTEGWWEQGDVGGGWRGRWVVGCGGPVEVGGDKKTKCGP
jgi:hypothetical protein